MIITQVVICAIAFYPFHQNSDMPLGTLRDRTSTKNSDRTTRLAIALIILHEEYGVDPLG
ncbi:MAG TPA: hypothetical protein V6D28_16050 [Leptolyngbyaceae cyanobacterium]